ncbi:MAG: MurR/RpiR family transcriptional regulator [Anaerolineae bacterium]|nr:MurR/RpiR family transcriptional regulator [Anaerolineae bacterium]
MFQDRIRENYDTLTPGFRKLADFILNSTLDVAFLTATQLSRRVGVDPATVVRFSQEIGYSGFRELSGEIKTYIRDRISASTHKVEEAKTRGQLFVALAEDLQKNLEQYLSMDLDKIIMVIEALKESRHIWIVAEHIGYDLASFMAKNLDTLGLSASAVYPSMSETALVIPEVQQDDVVLILVNDGPAIDAGYFTKLAKARGIKTFCITGSAVVPPAREADHVLIVPIHSAAGIPSFTQEALCLGLIWETLACELSEQTAASFQERDSHTKQLLEMRAETPEYEVGGPTVIFGRPNQL